MSRTIGQASELSAHCYSAHAYITSSNHAVPRKLNRSRLNIPRFTKQTGLALQTA
jgi:hypothetical protein